MSDSAADIMALARMIDAAVRLSEAKPGELGEAFAAFLTRLSVASGIPRAELDEMDTAAVHAVMYRTLVGNDYADMVGVAFDRWEARDDED